MHRTNRIENMAERPVKRYSKILIPFILVRRQIDYTGWDLIFTSHGKYYFYDTVECMSLWTPPESLLSYLLDLEPSRLSTLFNPKATYQLPTYDEVDMEGDDDIVDMVDMVDMEDEGEEGYQDEVNEEAGHGVVTDYPENDKEEDYVVPDEETHHPLLQEYIVHPKRDKKREQEEFIQMLRECPDLDPFQSWPTIASKFADDVRYQVIPTEKERKSLFDSICGELAEVAKRRRQGQVEAAKEQWKRCLGELTLATAPSTWTEYHRRIKKEPWFKLLDSSVMEKDYRARLSHLRERSIVYKIPK